MARWQSSSSFSARDAFGHSMEECTCVTCVSAALRAERTNDVATCVKQKKIDTKHTYIQHASAGSLYGLCSMLVRCAGDGWLKSAAETPLLCRHAVKIVRLPRLWTLIKKSCSKIVPWQRQAPSGSHKRREHEHEQCRNLKRASSQNLLFIFNPEIWHQNWPATSEKPVLRW